MIFIIEGFRSIVFIFIVISTTFQPICPLAFFRCLSSSRTCTELRTTSFIEPTGVACSDSVSVPGTSVNYTCIITRLQLGLNLQPLRRQSSGGWKKILNVSWLIQVICQLLDMSDLVGRPVDWEGIFLMDPKDRERCGVKTYVKALYRKWYNTRFVREKSFSSFLRDVIPRLGFSLSRPERSVYLTTKSVFDTEPFYSREPRTNRDSCVVNPKNAWSSWHFSFGTPQAPSSKLNPSNLVLPGAGEGPLRSGNQLSITQPVQMPETMRERGGDSYLLRVL